MIEETPEVHAGVDVSKLLLIVVGAHLRAEMADRPLAYRLSDRIEDWLEEHALDMNIRLTPVVCSDIWYVNQQALQNRPTVSLGGPGVNALSAYYANKLSSALVHDNQMVIQLDPEYVDLRVCVWGMDHEQTVHALDMFDAKYLDGYLRAAVTQVEPQED